MPISTAATYGTLPKSTRGCLFFVPVPIGEHLVHGRTSLHYRKTQNPRCYARRAPGAHAGSDVVTLVGGLVYWSQIVEAVAAV